MSSFEDITRNIGRDHQPETWQDWYEAFCERIDAVVGEPMPVPAELCADVVAEHLGLER